MTIPKLGKKKWVTIGIVTLLAFGGAGYKVYADKQHQDQLAQARVETNAYTQKLSALEKEVMACYDKSDTSFLVKDISSKDVLELKEKIDKDTPPTFKLTSKPLNKELKEASETKVLIKTNITELENKVAVQDAINQLFQKEQAINGSEIKAELVIADELNSEQLVTLEKQDTSTWGEKINALLKNATDQLAHIKQTSELLNSFFKEQQIVDPIPGKDLTEAVEAVKKIKNEKARQTQEARLKQVTDEVAKRQKVAEKTQAEATAQTSGGTVVTDANGNYRVEGGTNMAGVASNQSTQTNSTPSGNNTSGNTGSGSTGNVTGGGSTSGNTGGAPSSGSPGGNNSGPITGNQTGGGTITGGVGGGGNTWTGGDFDGSDIPEW